MKYGESKFDIIYLLMYRIFLRVYEEKEDRKLSITIYILAAVRVLLCLLPQNGWLWNDGSVLWGVLRNIPFVALGGVIVYLYCRRRAAIPCFRPVLLLVTLSFLWR